MDFKALPPDPLLDRIDRISVSFGSSRTLETRQKLNKHELKRFFDNLFYFLSISSKEFALVNNQDDFVDTGSLESIAKSLFESLCPGEPDCELRLGVGVGLRSDIKDMVGKLADEFEIDNLNHELISRKAAHFLERVLRSLMVQLGDASGIPQTSVDGYFDEQLVTFQKFITRNFQSKLRSQSMDQGLFKSTEFKRDFSNFKAEEMTRQNLEHQLQRISAELNGLEAEIRASLDSNLCSEGLKTDVENICSWAKKFDARKNEKPSDIENRSKMTQLKPSRILVSNVNESKSRPKKRQTFLPFFRVKELMRSSLTLVERGVPLQRGHEADCLNSDDSSKVDSFSYHICDANDQTFSLSDGLSQEEMAAAKISNYLTSKLQVKRPQITMHASPVRQKEKHSKSFTTSIKEIETTPNTRIPQYPLQSASVSADSAIPLHSLISMLRPLDPTIETVLNDPNHAPENSLRAFFQNIHAKLLSLEHLADRESSKSLLKTTNNGLESKVSVDKHIEDLEKVIQSTKTQLEQKISEYQTAMHEFELLRVENQSSQDEAEAAKRQFEHLKALHIDLSSTVISQCKLASAKLKAVSETHKSFFFDEPKRHELLAIMHKLRQAYHSKLNRETESYHAEIANLNIQLTSYQHLLAGEQDKVKRIKSHTETFSGRLTSIESRLNSTIELLVQKITSMNSKLKTHISSNAKATIDLRKSNDRLASEKKDVSYMNSNLLKELNELSKSVSKLTAEKEKLEEQVTKISELEDENSDLKLKIAMLNEKMEMASSLKDIADKEFAMVISERNNPYNFQQKNCLSPPFDSLEPHYLRTIDENDELAEGAEMQEGQSQYNPNSSQTKEHNPMIVDYLQSPKLHEFHISSACNFFLRKSGSFDSNAVSVQETDRPTPEIRASPSHKKPATKKQRVLFIDSKNFDQYIQLDNDDLSERRMFGDEKTPTEARKFGEPSSRQNTEQRSSNKKNLFSMQNVFKNLGNVVKSTTPNENSTRHIDEFRPTEDYTIDEAESRRKGSQPNTALDEVQSSSNVTELQYLVEVKDGQKNKQLFISSGSNPVLGHTNDPSPINRNSKIMVRLVRQMVKKNLDKASYLSQVLNQFEDIFTTKINSLGGKIKDIQSLSTQGLIRPLSHQTNAQSLGDDRLQIDAIGCLIYQNSAQPESRSSKKSQEQHQLGRLRLSEEMTETLAGDYATFEIDLIDSHRHFHYAENTSVTIGRVIDIPENEVIELETVQQEYEMNISPEQIQREYEELKTQCDLMHHDLENVIGLNNEYEGVLEFTYNTLKGLLNEEDILIPESELNIQILLELVSKEYSEMKNRLLQMRDPSVYRSSGHRNSIRNSDDSLKKKFSGDNLTGKNHKSSERSIQEVEYGDDRDNQLTQEDIILGTDKKQRRSADPQEIDEEEELEPEQVSDAVQNDHISEEGNNPGNQLENQIQDFQAKQSILKECFNDLLTNILHVINEDFTIITRSGDNINKLYEEATLAQQELVPVQDSPPEIFTETFSFIENLYQNHQTLKEMTEFLNVHLMKFFSEVDSYQEHVLENVPHSEQILELVHENDFLYHKLNESNKKIEQMFFHLQKYEKEYPEIAKKLSTNFRRAHSVPSLSFSSDTDQPQDSQDLQEKIRKFLEKLNERFEDQLGAIAIEDQTDGYIDSRRINSAQTNERDLMGNDPEADQENNIEKKVGILENYNLFLLNFIRKIKQLIDDRGTPVTIRMGHLSEISKELDEM
jgi:hypothetical protein